MNILFRDSHDTNTTRLIARIVAQDSLPADLPRAVKEGAESSRFSGKAGQLFEGFYEADGAVVRLALAGAGKADAADRSAALEKAGAALSAKYLTSGETALALDAAASGLSAEETASVLLGARLRGWRWDEYRTKLRDEQKKSLAEIVVVGAPSGTDTAWADSEAVAKGVELTRELVSEPPNIIYPESFVARCRERYEGTGLTVRVLDEAEMASLGMGALLGVSQGSVREGQLLVVEWKGGGNEAPTVFVGKGVTFDTGGISLKPPAGMEDMKWDMGGAGAVAGAMLAIAGRKAKANIVGVCGLVENMPDGNAQRPGDIVTTMSGQTVEVINTDAEGRLVLCDALTWVQQEFSPKTVVDFATLTGAMIISLGNEHGGVFANDDALAEKLLSAGKASGDKLWRFPLSPEYDKLIDSPIADMKNVGPRGAGSITAAQFLQRYIEDGVAWAHCDIAGMVWADKPGATWDKGATGYGTRLIDSFVRDSVEG
ncbi:leucyl aminopeptidase [Erythrobacter sp. EC-HK427]|uniref:leucyl aminopeptidase n=1 Tax=Erythrobacter sp. EC-HK427 TaxID=2038396 RepID=UPI001254E2FB|nr:leucyl aminopeptidase [Erythrobacter sp. EC-HK427]VVT20383.1 putative cytosol aminopeptidase [Erythrobacter sp. EC-HK427]